LTERRAEGSEASGLLRGPAEELARFEDEVLRIHERFLVEVIEKLHLCPWAEGTRQSGALRRAVILDQDPVGEILAWDENVLVGILIFPRFSGGPEAFDEHLKQLRNREQQQRKSPFVTALFHPRLSFSTETADQMVPLFRRSPDPSVQLIRHAALESVRSAAPSGKFLFDGSAQAFAELARREHQLPVSDKIARDNAVTVEQQGVASLLAIYDDLLADRNRSYANFGEV
jgi:hypothetical protein